MKLYVHTMLLRSHISLYSLIIKTSIFCRKKIHISYLPRAQPEPVICSFPIQDGYEVSFTAKHNKATVTCSVDVEDGGEVLGILVKEIFRRVAREKLVTVLQNLAATSYWCCMQWCIYLWHEADMSQFEDLST